jgi:hypothetical protein
MGTQFMSAASIAKALGGRGLSHSGWYSCNCPVCGSEGRLGLKDDAGKLAANCFKLCRRADILAELDRLGLLSDAPGEPEDHGQVAGRRAKEEAERRRQIAEARDFIANECFPWNTTDQIPRYLRGRDIDPSGLPSTIMWHGLAHHREGGSRPLMVGVIEHVDMGIIGATRTFLSVDGSQKASFNKPRLFLGGAAGGAVRLGPVSPDIELVIGEGIESTLSYMQMMGLPGWAALSACGIAKLVLPPEARRIVIAADNDKNGVGLKAARRAARRWCGEMRRVRVDLPPVPGIDWNNVLVGRGAGAAA